MKLLVLTYGSRGDFQPFLALAEALIAAGHDARLGAPPGAGFAELAAERGVPFTPIGTLWTADDVRDLQRRAPVSDPVEMMSVVISDMMFRDVEGTYARCREAARDVDLIVSHFGQPLGQMTAETMTLPLVTAMLDPFALPSRYRRPPGARRRIDWLLDPLIGRWRNLSRWKATTATLDAAFDRSINTVRAQLGLRPLPHPGSESLYSRHLNLVAVSPNVIPPAADWAPRHRLTGYWFLRDEAWTPPPELSNFLTDGPRPVAISLGGPAGSMPTDDSSRLTALIVEALTKSGVRAIIDPGALDLGAGDLPPSVLRHSPPHAWLFPRVAAVVHHGGAGTTAAAFRAGVPSVVVPQAWDQPMWAETATRAGVATQPIPRPELTATKLAEAITTAISDRRSRDRAETLAQRINGEDGTGAAVALIESVNACSARSLVTAGRAEVSAVG